MSPEALLARYTAPEMAERLAWLLSALADRSDVRDGSDGHQLPNECTAIAVAYDQRFPVLVRGPHIWEQVPMQERRSIIRAAAPKERP